LWIVRRPRLPRLLATLLFACGCSRKAPDAAAKAELKCSEGMVLVPTGPFNYGRRRAPIRAQTQRDKDGQVDLFAPTHAPETFIAPLKTIKETLPAFCIDKYEYPNRTGTRPRVGLTWMEAAALCRKAGKRLCTEYEWEKACRGTSGQDYPYGRRFRPGACALLIDEPGGYVSGSCPQCKSPYGAYDMSGGVWEWTMNRYDPVSGREERVLRGGALSGDKRRSSACSFRMAGVPGGVRPLVGVRCCSSPSE